MLVEPFTAAGAYPEKCLATAALIEKVTVGFRITLEGEVEAPQIKASTNDCFNQEALRRVGELQFRPSGTKKISSRTYTFRREND